MCDCNKKQCLTCKKFKEEPEYSKTSWERKYSECKACKSEYNKEYHKKLREEKKLGIVRIKDPINKKCNQCGKTKNRKENFSPSASQCHECRKENYQTRDKNRILAQEKEKRDKNREELQAQLKDEGKIPKEGCKFCKVCGEEKLLDQFPKQVQKINTKRWAFYATCLECFEKKKEEDWEKMIHQECSCCKTTKEKKEFCKYKSRCKKCDAEWRQKEENKQKSSAYAKEHYKKPEIREARNAKRREWRREQMRTNPQFKLEKILRDRLYHLVKSGDAVKFERAFNLVGCSLPELRLHLESLWKPEMNWRNHGFGEGKWCIDHIIPVASRDLTKLENQKTVFHFSNLQPLWWSENADKSDWFEHMGEMVRARELKEKL
jgi:hypothetical protein